MNHILRRIAQGILIILAFILLTATILSILPLSGWWSRVFDFPRVQIIVLAGLVLLFYVILFRTQPPKNWLLYGAMAGVIIYQSTLVYPYTRFTETQTAYEPTEDSTTLVRMVISNVLMTNRQADAVLRLVDEKDPDLVLLMETDPWWQQQMKPLEEEYTHKVLHPLDNTYGMLLYSRLPLHQAKVHYLLKDSIPSIHAYLNLPSGQRVKLYCLHPEPPVPKESKTSTKRDAELLLVGRMVEEKNEPAIVTGDLNDVAWSPTSRLFRKTSQMLDPRIGRGIFNTFHAQYPLFRWPLDHVYHTDHFQVVELVVLPDVGSDHFPVYFNLSFQPGEKWQQENPKPADSKDKEKAEKMIDEGFEEKMEEESESNP